MQSLIIEPAELVFLEVYQEESAIIIPDNCNRK